MKKYARDAVSSGWLSSEGPYVEQFEKQFAAYLGVKYATSTNSGTTALHLALLSLGIGKGDEVILPASTIASCFFAIWYTGAKAVAVDVDPETYTLDPLAVEAAISPRTKAIMPVHLFGHPCDMDRIISIAKRNKLFILEDAAEAHGAEYKGKKVGGIGDMGCFSFYGNKIVTCGEGGMVVTNDQSLYQIAKRLKNLNHSSVRFIHEGVGYKYVITNVQAAIGLASLENINLAIKYKQGMAALYRKHLSVIPGVNLPVEKSWAKSVYWMYAIRISEKKFHMSKDALMSMLLTKYSIQTRSFFYPPNIAFPRNPEFSRQKFPVSQQISDEGMYLPSGLGNTRSEFISASKAVKGIYKDS